MGERCDFLAPQEGGYPFVFYGAYPVADRNECVQVLGDLGRGELAVPAGSVPRPVDEGLE